METEIKSMKPPVSYYGGKQRMASRIIPHIPKHTVYCEPFCGGATILFKKPYPEITDSNHYREIINDVDESLINFFKQLRENGDELCRRIELTLYSEKEHANSTGENLYDDDPIEWARKYYVNIHQSFSAIKNGGWARVVYGPTLSLGWQKRIDSLINYVPRIKQVAISCDDYSKIIKQYDSPQTFFYVDPPYPGTYQKNYSQQFDFDDFDKLIEQLDGIQGSFILSCYDYGFDVPSDWEKIEFESYCAASGKGQVNADRSKKVGAEKMGNRKRIETIFKRDARVEPRDEIKKLYESGKFDCFTG